MRSVNCSIKSSGPRAMVWRAIGCTRLSIFLGAIPGWVRYAFTRAKTLWWVGENTTGCRGNKFCRLGARRRAKPADEIVRPMAIAHPVYFLYLPILSSRRPPFFLHRNQLTTLVMLNKLRQNER